MKRELTWGMALVAVGVWTLAGAATGCSSDDSETHGGTGGVGGTGGSGGSGGSRGSATGGAGGKGTGGSGTGGKGSGGVPGTGGKGSGGTPVDGGDGGCVAPNSLVYRSPGCGPTVVPECLPPPKGAVDAGLTEACACDGTSIYGGRGYTKPYRYLGECRVPDSGTDSGDAGKDAH